MHGKHNYCEIGIVKFLLVEICVMMSFQLLPTVNMYVNNFTTSLFLLSACVNVQ